MKQIISDMVRDAQNELDRMKKSRMSMEDRVAYEKAKILLKTLRDILYRCTVNLQD